MNTAHTYFVYDCRRLVIKEMPTATQTRHKAHLSRIKPFEMERPMRLMGPIERPSEILSNKAILDASK